MYANVKTCVKVDNKRTSMFATNVGVKQGDALSPLLFNLFSNDIPDKLMINERIPTLNNQSVNCLMYVYDLVILSTSARGLQLQMDKLHDFCIKWHLNINIQKTKVIEFNSQGRMVSRMFNYGRLIIDNVKEYQYLGILISASGTFMPAMNTLYNGVFFALFHLKGSINNNNINPKLGLKLFDNLIKPILLYNS